MLSATPLTPVRAEAGFEEQLVRPRRAPRGLLHALAEAREIRTNFGSRDVRAVRAASRVRRPRRAADDFPLARLAAAVFRPENARALAGELLIPEQVELLAVRRLRRESQRAVAP